VTDSGRREAYLEALGLTVWRLRSQATTEEAVTIARDLPETVEGAPTTTPRSSVVPDGDKAPVASLDWDALQARVAQCQGCSLHAGRTQGVFGIGDRNADWLFIGEAPGKDEDRLGEPFVGLAGQLLDAMLAAAGTRRESVYIANIIKSRPPSNRDPTPEEIEACLPYLRRQIELVSPRLVMLVGRVAAQTMLESSNPVGRLRGQVHRLPGSGIPAVVTYHPAYLLRSPQEKRKVWDDLRLAKRVLAGAEGPGS
jgi:uracil-DNA glycosylase